jgi:hypothetical protein
MRIWNEILQLLVNIATDMLEPMEYIPLGILAGVIFLFLWNFWYISRLQVENPASKKRKWSIFICIVYSTVLLYLVIFSREPGSRDGVDLGIFDTWGDSMISHAYFIENILMFLPFGILFPFAFSKLQKGSACIAAGIGFSVLLEVFQLLTKRGFCQLDDILTNAFGTVLGWSIYKIIQLRARRKRFNENHKK